MTNESLRAEIHAIGFQMAEQGLAHARRVDELLASNNALLERARKAEAERDAARHEADALRAELAAYG